MKMLLDLLLLLSSNPEKLIELYELQFYIDDFNKIKFIK